MWKKGISALVKIHNWFNLSRMTLHIVKLCVGAETIDDLVNWQKRLMKTSDKPYHNTRMMPKRAEEVLQGGSIYWVIKRAIRVRQSIIAINEVADRDGRRMCELVFDPQLHPTYAQPKRPFQGWRYLKHEDIPRDLTSSEAAIEIPVELDLALKKAMVW